MRIFLAGAGGVVGQRLLPLLVEAGHAVVAMTRSPGKADGLRAAGAEPVVADALDEQALMAAVRQARPDVVVHQLTAIPPKMSVRTFDRDFALTNRLRTEGTDHLIAAARAVGARRVVAQSFAGWPYAREGGLVKTEADPLDPNPPRAFRRALAAIRYLETTVLGDSTFAGVVLRYGIFYGPGTSFGGGGSILDAIRRRRLPIVGRGTGVWSFVHIDDVASGTLAAVERGAPGIYNIVDDEPASVAVWLPALAAALRAEPPQRVPLWIGRLIVGDHGVALMTQGAWRLQRQGQA